jgi:hypothetical protein
LLDYRDLPQDGRFDKVVSVGMFEHVGHANLAEYCKTLFGAVKEGGLVMNHGITAKHTDGRPVGRGAGDFIEKYVFPNGELPHLAMISAEISEAGWRSSMSKACVCTTHAPWTTGASAWKITSKPPPKRCRIKRCGSGGCTWQDAPTRSPGLDQPAPDPCGEDPPRWQP